MSLALYFGSIVVLFSTILAQASFINVEIVENELDGYDEAIQHFLDEAASMWNKVILTELEDLVFSSRTNIQEFCQVEKSFEAGESVTNLRVLLQIKSAAKSIQAEPCVYAEADGTFFPRIGVITLDAEDFKPYITDNDFFTTRLLAHEIGHILGLGTMWTSQGLATGSKYNGKYGVRGYMVVSNNADATSVPLSNDVSSGALHWDEDSLGTELMTSHLNGRISPLSVLSVNALRDLGFTVNTKDAENFDILHAFHHGGDNNHSQSQGANNHYDDERDEHHRGGDGDHDEHHRGDDDDRDEHHRGGDDDDRDEHHRGGDDDRDEHYRGGVDNRDEHHRDYQHQGPDGDYNRSDYHHGPDGDYNRSEYHHHDHNGDYNRSDYHHGPDGDYNRSEYHHHNHDGDYNRSDYHHDHDGDYNRTNYHHHGPDGNYNRSDYHNHGLNGDYERGDRDNDDREGYHRGDPHEDGHEGYHRGDREDDDREGYHRGDREDDDHEGYHHGEDGREGYHRGDPRENDDHEGYHRGDHGEDGREGYHRGDPRENDDHEGYHRGDHGEDGREGYHRGDPREDDDHEDYHRGDHGEDGREGYHRGDPRENDDHEDYHRGETNTSTTGGEARVRSIDLSSDFIPVTIKKTVAVFSNGEISYRSVETTIAASSPPQSENLSESVKRGPTAWEISTTVLATVFFAIIAAFGCVFLSKCRNSRINEDAESTSSESSFAHAKTYSSSSLPSDERMNVV